MKTLLLILVCISLSVQCPASTITRADIIKTVEHLQQRCHEAEAAQSDAQTHSRELQGRINALAEHDQEQTAKVATLTKENNTLKGRIDKLALALAVAAGLFIGLLASKFTANPVYPIGIGLATIAATFSWLRFLL